MDRTEPEQPVEEIVIEQPIDTNEEEYILNEGDLEVTPEPGIAPEMNVYDIPVMDSSDEGGEQGEVASQSSQGQVEKQAEEDKPRTRNGVLVIELIQPYDGFYIGEIPKHIVATTYTAPGRDNSFDRLGGYIFGANVAQDSIDMTSPVTSQKIDMTSPVVSQKIDMTSPVVAQELDGYTMTRFVMPSSWSMETLPVPTNENVTIEEIPAQTVAVWEFNGYARDREVAQQREEFKEKLDKYEIDYVLPYTAARYNGPWTAPSARKNQIWVTVQL